MQTWHPSCSHILRWSLKRSVKEANLDRLRLFHQWECLKCDGHGLSVSCVKWPWDPQSFKTKPDILISLLLWAHLKETTKCSLHSVRSSLHGCYVWRLTPYSLLKPRWFEIWAFNCQGLRVSTFFIEEKEEGLSFDIVIRDSRYQHLLFVVVEK